MAWYVWGECVAILQFRTLSIPGFPYASLDTGRRCRGLLWAARLSRLCFLLCLCCSPRKASRLLLSVRSNSDGHGRGQHSQPSSAHLPPGFMSWLHPFFLPSQSWGKHCPRCPLPGRETPLCQWCCNPLGWLWLWVSLHFAGWKAPKKQFKDPMNNPYRNKSALLFSTVFLFPVSPFNVIRK